MSPQCDWGGAAVVFVIKVIFRENQAEAVSYSRSENRFKSSHKHRHTSCSIYITSKYHQMPKPPYPLVAAEDSRSFSTLGSGLNVWSLDVQIVQLSDKARLLRVFTQGSDVQNTRQGLCIKNIHTATATNDCVLICAILQNRYITT